jgi:hypothetical protein
VDYKKVDYFGTTHFDEKKNSRSGLIRRYILRTLVFCRPNNPDMLLPLTLRREDDVYQSVLLVLGEVNKTDIRIETRKIYSQLEDMEEKYELYICLKESDFKLSLPMLKYFNDLIDGAVRSNNNPALTHGIASLDTMLLKEFGNSNTSDSDSRNFCNREYYTWSKNKKI